MKKTTSVFRPSLLPRLICAALSLASATHVLADDSSSADKAAVKTSADKNNAISGAEDGFGNQSGKESIGIYDDGNVRGFSPAKAGNLRIEGMYFDRAAYLGHLLTDGSKVRVGPLSAAMPFRHRPASLIMNCAKPAISANGMSVLKWNSRHADAATVPPM